MTAYEFEVVTLFPELVAPWGKNALFKRAQERGVVRLTVTDLRDHTLDKHRTADDEPYGGGAGMVLKPEPLIRALRAARERVPETKVALLTPRGQVFTQRFARNLATAPGLVLLCGRYEGIDERVTRFVDHEISVGDFVLNGGEAAALCVLEAVARLLPGMVGNEESLAHESFESGALEYPHYTRPPEFEGAQVPKVLQGGDHRRIALWRRYQALVATRDRRPELFARLVLSAEDRALLALSEDDLDEGR